MKQVLKPFRLSLSWRLKSVERAGMNLATVSGAQPGRGRCLVISGLQRLLLVLMLPWPEPRSDVSWLPLASGRSITTTTKTMGWHRLPKQNTRQPKISILPTPRRAESPNLSDQGCRAVQAQLLPSRGCLQDISLRHEWCGSIEVLRAFLYLKLCTGRPLSSTPPSSISRGSALRDAAWYQEVTNWRFGRAVRRYDPFI